MDIVVSPGKVLKILLALIAILLIGNIIGIVLRFQFNHGAYGLVELFDFNAEQNVPTLYSSLQLALASVLLLIVAMKQYSSGSVYFGWFLLALIFLFLMVDETAQIHEKLIGPVRKRLNLTNAFFFAWVVPYGAAVLVLIVGYSKFLLNLPRLTAIRFIVSGAIYVTGAIGFEMLSAQHMVKQGSSDNMIFAIYSMGEELLEMLGIALFIHALLAYFSSEFRYLRYTISDQ